MRRFLALRGRSSMLAIILGFCACAQPLLPMPEELAGKADVYPVHGRHAFLFFEPDISFGPYRTVSIHRGLFESDSTGGSILASERRESSHQDFDFTLQGPGSGPWRARCRKFSERVFDTRIVGFHVGTDGTGLNRNDALISFRAGYDCDLAGPAAEHWTLHADPRLWEGSVTDATGAAVVDVEGDAARRTWQHPDLEGNTLVGTNGELYAVVQRSYSGAVYLSRELDPGRRAAVAAICTALLIEE